LDSQQFLLVRAAGGTHAGASPLLIVVQQFEQELKRLVPTK
jgi:hypothetical protein